MCRTPSIPKLAWLMFRAGSSLFGESGRESISRIDNDVISNGGNIAAHHCVLRTYNTDVFFCLKQGGVIHVLSTEHTMMSGNTTTRYISHRYLCAKLVPDQIPQRSFQLETSTTPA